MHIDVRFSKVRQKSEVFGGRTEPERDNLTESVRGNRFLNFERVPAF